MGFGYGRITKRERILRVFADGKPHTAAEVSKRADLTRMEAPMLLRAMPDIVVVGEVSNPHFGSVYLYALK